MESKKKRENYKTLIWYNSGRWSIWLICGSSWSSSKERSRCGWSGFNTGCTCGSSWSSSSGRSRCGWSCYSTRCACGSSSCCFCFCCSCCSSGCCLLAIVKSINLVYVFCGEFSSTQSLVWILSPYHSRKIWISKRSCRVMHNGYWIIRTAKTVDAIGWLFVEVSFSS